MKPILWSINKDDKNDFVNTFDDSNGVASR